MSVLTKKRRTRSAKHVRLTFIGPENRRARAVAGLAKLGFVLENPDTGEAVSWQDAFPDVQENLPGTVLSGARAKAGLTQVQLADQSGIPQRHISEMEHGKRLIGKERARRLAKVLDIPYQTLL